VVHLKNPSKNWRIVWLLLLMLTLAMGYYFKGYLFQTSNQPTETAVGPDAVLDNYGADIRQCASEFGFSAEYLAALCMLESGGRKPVPSRFEKHVYGRLKMVQLRVRSQYEHVKHEDLSFAGDEALQNLASSWGPFQLMGYKCLLFNIKVRDLRGDDGIYWATKWMEENYGTYLRNEDYKSAFHIHNAGCPFPASGKSKTHDPQYVEKGLKWMEYFKGKI
jgi:hypothetical protein